MVRHTSISPLGTGVAGGELVGSGGVIVGLGEGLPPAVGVAVGG
jgi:hypothetical protein